MVKIEKPLDDERGSIKNLDELLFRLEWYHQCIYNYIHYKEIIPPSQFFHAFCQGFLLGSLGTWAPGLFSAAVILFTLWLAYRRIIRVPAPVEAQPAEPCCA